MSVDIAPAVYLDRLVDYGNVKVYALATVEETKQTWSAEDDLVVEKPNLDVQVQKKPFWSKSASGMFCTLCFSDS